MRTGDPARGFTYLCLLFAIAIGGAALAALGTQWQTAMQREREIELEFRGHEIVRAIESYWRATPSGRPPWPSTIDELLEDRRGSTLLRHLRRLYADPFTQQADWVLITDADGGIHGLHSRAENPALRVPASAASAASAAAKVSDKAFVAAARPQGSASAPAAAASAGLPAASGARP